MAEIHLTGGHSNGKFATEMYEVDAAAQVCFTKSGGNLQMANLCH